MQIKGIFFSNVDLFFNWHRERRDKERKEKEKRDLAGTKDDRDARGDPTLHREHLASSKPSKCKFLLNLTGVSLRNGHWAICKMLIRY